MSNTRCELLSWILLPVAVAALFSFILPSIDLVFTYILAIIALLAHIHYGTCVVSFILLFSTKHFIIQGIFEIVVQPEACNYKYILFIRYGI